MVPDVKGRALSFSPLHMMLAVGLSYMTFILLRCTPYILLYSLRCEFKRPFPEVSPKFSTAEHYFFAPLFFFFNAEYYFFSPPHIVCYFLHCIYYDMYHNI